MRLGWALFACVSCLGCGEGDRGDGDGDADADADADADGDADACGSGRGGQPEVAWVVSGGAAGDDLLSDVALEEGCLGVVAAIDHQGRFELAGVVAEGGETWSGLVVRFDAAGTPTWSAELGGSGHTLVNALATADGGAVWAAGSFEGSGTIAGEAVTSAGDDDAFAVRLGPDGSAEALAVIASTGSDVVFSATATPDGGLVLAGTFGGPMTLAGEAVDVVTPAQDVWVAKLDAEGAAQWVTTFGGDGNHNAGYEYPRAVTLGGEGDLVVAGRLANASTPGDWTDDNVAFVRHLDGTDGTVSWAQEIPWGYGNWGEVSAAGLGDEGFVLGGGFNDVLELGEVSWTEDGQPGLIARMDEVGTVQWVTLIDGPGEENVRDVAPGVEGEAIAIGDLASGVDLGGGSITATGKDPFLVGAATGDGSLAWSLVWGGSGSDDRGGVVDAHPRGRIVVGGELSGPLRVGDEEVAPVGGRDVWIASLRR